MSLTFIFFGILAILAIASGILTISSKNPIISAISLIFHFFMLAGIYLTLQAQFIAVMQILIYAGAIMVLVIFVIMLLNIGIEEQLKEKFNINKALAVMLTSVFVIQILGILFVQMASQKEVSPVSVSQGTVESIGFVLFNKYMFPFEAVSLLLLAAIVGSIVLAKRKID